MPASTTTKPKPSITDAQFDKAAELVEAQMTDPAWTPLVKMVCKLYAKHLKEVLK